MQRRGKGKERSDRKISQRGRWREERKGKMNLEREINRVREEQRDRDRHTDG